MTLWSCAKQPHLSGTILDAFTSNVAEPAQAAHMGGAQAKADGHTGSTGQSCSSMYHAVSKNEPNEEEDPKQGLVGTGENRLGGTH